MTTPGRRVFENSYVREKQDYDDLSRVREQLGADVFGLQEISSLAALARVFPASEYVLCLSGQFEADAKKLGRPIRILR